MTRLAASASARIIQTRAGCCEVEPDQHAAMLLCSCCEYLNASTRGLSTAVGCSFVQQMYGTVCTWGCHLFPAITIPAGFHYYRAELDAGVAGDPAKAHARRGAHWTFDAPAFVACVRSLKGAGGGHPAGGGAGNGDRGEPHDNGEEAVAVPSFAHGVGDPVPDDIRVASRHRVLLVEGNYLLLGAAFTAGVLRPSRARLARGCARLCA